MSPVIARHGGGDEGPEEYQGGRGQGLLSGHDEHLSGEPLVTGGDREGQLARVRPEFPVERRERDLHGRLLILLPRRSEVEGLTLAPPDGGRHRDLSWGVRRKNGAEGQRECALVAGPQYQPGRVAVAI